jgi:predicted amidophosphoribosyltransferase
MPPAESIAAYSLFPYSSQHKDDPRHLLERMRRYVLAFKYGRADEGMGRGYAEIVDDLARQGWASPAFDGAPVIVPVPPLDPPRRGETREPCWQLAEALARRVAGSRAERLWERATGVGWAQDQAPPTLDDHVRSLRRTASPLPREGERVALVVDLVTRGTELLACVLALRDEGFTGPVSAFVVAQATGRYPKPLQLQSFLVSEISGAAGDAQASRHDQDVWFDEEAEVRADPH